jgi:hypothetical protein
MSENAAETEQRAFQKKEQRKKVKAVSTDMGAGFIAAVGKVKGARKTGPQGKLRIHPKKGPRNVQRTTYFHGRV